MDSFPLLYSEEYKALRRPRRHDLTMGGVRDKEKGVIAAESSLDTAPTEAENDEREEVGVTD